MSDYLERLIGKAKHGDLWSELPQKSAPPTPSEKHSVRRDSFDISAWDQTTDQVRALGEMVAEAAEDHPTAPVAYEDLFNLLNQGDPRFQELASMLAEYVPQHAMLEGMFSSEDFKWVRNETRYDTYNTALAMLSMDKQMREALDDTAEAVEKIKQAQQELQDAIDAAQQLVVAGVEYIEGPPPPPGDEPTEIPEGPVTLKIYSEPGTDTQGNPVVALLPDGTDVQGVIDRLKAAMDGQAKAEAEGDAAGEEAAAQLRAGVSQARDDIEREKSQAQAYGIEPGKLKRMSYEERRRLSQRLDKNRLTRFANFIGAVRMMADADRRRKVSHAPAVIYDVELGNDLHKLVPSELNNLAIPETEDLLWLRYAQRSLLQWVTRGPEKQGKGPIIVVCDESYSMTSQLDAEGNTREAWSKAISLALADQARRGKRDFIYLGFSSRNEQWESVFVNGQGDHEQVIDFAEHFYGGGTHYEAPLTRAMEIIGTYEKAGKAKPDVVFITDDECQVNEAFVEAWREVKQRADVRCYGIRIGGTGQGTAMDDLVDRLISIEQFATPEDVQELFRTI